MSFLPPNDFEYLTSKNIVFEEHDAGGQKALILKDKLLPEERYDASKVNVLIQLPSGYPDVPPDMFYLLPWVKLKQGNRYPGKADQPHDFLGQKWQRWSRHCPEWRPGVDGIWTMLKRVDHAIKEAK